MLSPNYSKLLSFLNILLPIFIITTPVNFALFSDEFKVLFSNDGIMRGEWGPVELSTHLVLLLASIAGFITSFLYYKKKLSLKERYFVLLLSLATFILFLEEINWGQILFDFANPDLFRLNIQREANFHNLPELYGNSDLLTLLFGMLGLAGYYLRHLFPGICTPAFLLSWLWCIFVASILTMLNTYYRSFYIFYPRFFWSLGEYTELLVGVSILLYFTSSILDYKRKIIR